MSVLGGLCGVDMAPLWLTANIEFMPTDQDHAMHDNAVKAFIVEKAVSTR
ncbi:hypothetical protein [Cryobacterium sp. TMT4-10]|nr:hypothetical protein [Cryobacterium sp. TMT4-10]